LDAIDDTYSRDSATPLPAAPTKKRRRSLLARFFARFLEALKDTRRREARRVIANHAHLLADETARDEAWRGKP